MELQSAGGIEGPIATAEGLGRRRGLAVKTENLAEKPSRSLECSHIAQARGDSGEEAAH